MRARAARSRELIAKGRKPAVVARVLQVNRTGLYGAEAAGEGSEAATG